MKDELTMESLARNIIVETHFTVVVFPIGLRENTHLRRELNTDFKSEVEIVTWIRKFEVKRSIVEVLKEKTRYIKLRGT